MKKDKKHLKLTAETIRALTATQLTNAPGGVNFASQTCSNNSCDPLHTTCKLN